MPKNTGKANITQNPESTISKQIPHKRFQVDSAEGRALLSTMDTMEAIRVKEKVGRNKSFKWRQKDGSIIEFIESEGRVPFGTRI